MTAPVAKRADQLVVGDRIPDEHLAFRFNQGPAEVVFVVYEDTTPLPWTFVAYRYPNGQHDSMTVRPEAVMQVFSAPVVLLTCPSCGSPDPRLHPAVQSEGEVSAICPDGFHASPS